MLRYDIPCHVLDVKYKFILEVSGFIAASKTNIPFIILKWAFSDMPWFGYFVSLARMSWHVEWCINGRDIEHFEAGGDFVYSGSVVLNISVWLISTMSMIFVSCHELLWYPAYGELSSTICTSWQFKNCRIVYWFLIAFWWICEGVAWSFV